MEPLTDVELERRKRNFIAARENKLSILALSLVFAATLAATWLASTGLLWLGLKSMPLRYAASILIGYGTFFMAVRIWADFQKAHPADRGSNSTDGYFDMPSGSEEGCLVVAIIVIAAVVLATLLSWLGAVVMLEVAFEVIFAGVLVRRVGRLDEVGQWAQVLFKRTWWLALLILLVTSGIAHHYQSKYPLAAKVSDVWKMGKP
jgi:hypothetical protein